MIAMPIETLLHPLKSAMGPAKGKQSLPILSCVLVKCLDSVLTVTASDLETQIIADTHLDHEPFELCLNADKLHSIVSKLPEQSNLRMTATDNQVTLTVGRSRYSLGSLNPENFPAFDRTAPETVFTLEASRLRRLLSKTAFAMAVEDVRYYLKGVALEIHPNTLVCRGFGWPPAGRVRDRHRSA
jgi:DNA polymerase-3 subunit beta